MSDHTSPLKLTRLEPYESRLRLLPFVGHAWLPVCRSADVPAGRARAERFAGFRLVLFRDPHGAVRAIEDRCPHRGVPLSLGACVRGRLVCAYHGLEVGGDGRFGNLCMRTFAVREHLGLVWVFAGDDPGAAPLPDLYPFGTTGFVDTVLSLDMRTHYSLVLDNGVDLTHDYLHRNNLFFFKVLGLDGVKEEVAHIEIAYRAELRDEFNRAREGAIRIRFAGHLVRLDFDGLPIIHSVLTPRAANGRAVTQWWFVSFRARRALGLVYRVLLPFIRRIMLAAFRQDRLMLEHEAEAVFERGFRQTERNPLVRAVEASLRARLVAQCLDRLPSMPVQTLTAQEVSGLVGRGELAVFDPEALSPLTQEELAHRLGSSATVRVHRDWACALLAR
ncbi:MAG TPA: Rieske 2Fe-2S domain-containing protein [Gemmata sp.]